jgi:hypothetical protein
MRKLKGVRRLPALLALAVAVTVGSTVYATEASAAPAASAAGRVRRRPLDLRRAPGPDDPDPAELPALGLPAQGLPAPGIGASGG